VTTICCKAGPFCVASTLAAARTVWASNGVGQVGAESGRPDERHHLDNSDDAHTVTSNTRPISPLADFSFDYADLSLTPGTGN